LPSADHSGLAAPAAQETLVARAPPGPGPRGCAWRTNWSRGTGRSGHRARESLDKGQGARGRPGGLAPCRPGSIGRFLAAAHSCLGTARPKRGGQGWRTGRAALRLPPRGGPGRPPTGPPGGGPAPSHSSNDLRRLGCPGPTEDNPHYWWPPPPSPSRRPRVLRNKGAQSCPQEAAAPSRCRWPHRPCSAA
jgi:hypothetical protein